MGLIDFKEIACANHANGEQDQFELFTRDFLAMLGFSIVDGPDRGQDGGRDLIVEETRTGIVQDTVVRWLVSCKHKIHSGNSVNTNDEQDIADRVRAHKCDAFMGVYSTIVSSPLNRKINGLRDDFEVEIFDAERIESLLLSKESGKLLIKRFFPNSFLKIDEKIPTNILSKYTPLKCKVCGRDLLKKDMIDHYSGILVFVQDMDAFEGNNTVTKYTEVYCVCKGNCDRVMENRERPYSFLTSWEDISDLTISARFLKFIMAVMNRMYQKLDIYTEDAFAQLKDIIILIAQITLKKHSEEDLERIRELSELPPI